jgi:hypothetical protein
MAPGRGPLSGSTNAAAIVMAHQSSEAEISTAAVRLAVGIASSLRRLACSHHFLNYAQRLEIAEIARDLADRLDAGEGDRLQHGLQRRRMALITANGPFGRPLFKLL